MKHARRVRKRLHGKKKARSPITNADLHVARATTELEARLSTKIPKNDDADNLKGRKNLLLLGSQTPPIETAPGEIDWRAYPNLFGLG